MLLIKNLSVNIENKIVIKDLNLNIKEGEIHAIMGPNGSGKSTLSKTIAGEKHCVVSKGEISFKNLNLIELSPEKRACEGVFVSFQNSIEIPGVNNKLFLQTSLNEIRKYKGLPILEKFEFVKFIKQKIELLEFSPDFLYRSVNVGFSGGEKKKNDILQMMILEPSLCILDEIDSGLDIDAIKIISNIINQFRSKIRAFIIITHYQRILNYIKPNFIHIFYKGKIVRSGDFSLIKYLEEKGYNEIANRQ